MRIKKKMTANSYLKAARLKFKKGIVLDEVLNGSSPESIIEVKKANSEFLSAAIDYIKLAEKKVQEGYIPPQEGRFVKSSEERKRLVKSFSFDTEERRKLFYIAPYSTTYESLPYQLLEATFDASLMIEPLAEKRFRETWAFYNSFVGFLDDVNSRAYFSTYGDHIFFIKPSDGTILKLTSKPVIARVKTVGVKTVMLLSRSGDKPCGMYLIFKDNQMLLLFDLEKSCLVEGLFENYDVLKDKNKLYYQICVKNATDNASAVRFNAHTVIILAEYGIDVAKHMVLKDSLITIDHLDGVGNHNSATNLQLVTRRDNKLRAVAKDVEVRKSVYAFDFAPFFAFVDSCFNMDKLDVKMIVDWIAEIWSKKLAESTPETILLTYNG